MQEYIGREIEIAAHPYHYGRAVIESIEPGTNGWENYFVVTVRTVDATETSRLFQHTTKQPFNDRTIKMYHFSEDNIRRAAEGELCLSFSYPV